MRFEFATAGRIVFGEGAARQAAAAAAALGRRALLVCGSRSVALPDAVRFEVHGEPTIESIRNGSAVAREAGCDVVVGVGGGSAIDAAKAIAAMLTNPGDPLDYLEVIGAGRALEKAAAPVIAIPTTAGTGSEVTRNAVLASPEHGVKASVRHPGMLPAVAIVDPEMTYDLPRELTVSTGLDALTQLIEPYVSVRANRMTDLFCAEGIRRVADALPRLRRNTEDREARGEMAWASLLGGMALANAALGAVHGFAAPVGGMFPAPHGAVCAALLPHVMNVNIRALRERERGHAAIDRYRDVARWLTGHDGAAPEDGVEWVARLCELMEVPPLAKYGVEPAHYAVLAGKAAEANSMKGNPIRLTGAELLEIVTLATEG